MPRVNRDLQRRMAARRDRERRRPPTERRYRFGSSETPVDADETLANGEDGAAGTAPTAVATRPSPAAPVAQRSFTEHRAEYSYVLTDLRRIVVVVGSILAVLLVLYFVLPR